MPIRARSTLLLDLDGTLVDPAPGILGCYRRALASFSVFPPDARPAMGDRAVDPRRAQAVTGRARGHRGCGAPLSRAVLRLARLTASRPTRRASPARAGRTTPRDRGNPSRLDAGDGVGFSRPVRGGLTASPTFRDSGCDAPRRGPRPCPCPRPKLAPDQPPQSPRRAF